MRVNIYAEEITGRVELVHKISESTNLTHGVKPVYIGIRFYTELPATVDGKQYRGPFIHQPGDDDSAAVTFWGKRDLIPALEKALALLYQHYRIPAPHPFPVPEEIAPPLLPRDI